jgi:hypothetical protein
VYRENLVVLDRILRVNLLYKAPVFLHYFEVPCSYPKVSTRHETLKESFTLAVVLNSQAEFRQQVDCLTVDCIAGQLHQQSEKDLKKVSVHASLRQHLLQNP